MSATKVLSRGSRFVGLVCGIAIAAGAACTYYSARVVPTELSVSQEKLLARDVRLHVNATSVMLNVEAIAFPLVTGTVREAAGAPVRFDLRFASAAHRANVTSPSTVGGNFRAKRGEQLSLDSLRRAPRALIGSTVWFVAERGPVVLQNISSIDGTVVEGEVVGGAGVVTVDLNRVTKLEVMELDMGRSIAKTVARTALTTGAVVVVLGTMMSGTPARRP